MRERQHNGLSATVELVSVIPSAIAFAAYLGMVYESLWNNDAEAVNQLFKWWMLPAGIAAGLLRGTSRGLMDK